MWNLFLQYPLHFLVICLICYVIAFMIAFSAVSKQINSIYNEMLNPGPSIRDSIQLIRRHMAFWSKALAILELLIVLALFLFF